MNLYFFFRNDSSQSWYDLTLEAWEENDNTYIDGKKASSFSLLERIKMHISKHPEANTERKKFFCARFDHEWGTSLCTGHSAKTVREFRKEKTEQGYQVMTETTHTNFQRFRKIAFKINNRYPVVNFTEQLMKDSPVCRILC